MKVSFTFTFYFTIFNHGSLDLATNVVINRYRTPRLTKFGSCFLVFIKCAVIPDRLYRDSLTLLGTFFIKGKYM